MNKYIAEIAEECGVSKDTIRRMIKRLNITTEKDGNGITVLGEQAYKLILSEVGIKSSEKTQESEQETTSGVSESLLSEQLMIQIEMLKSDIERILSEKNAEIDRIIADKQAQIDSLNHDKAQLYKQIDGLHEQLKVETVERQTILAKYLIMNNEQEEQQEVQPTVVDPEPVKATPEQESQEEQPHKQSILSRIFGKKTR